MLRVAAHLPDALVLLRASGSAAVSAQAIRNRLVSSSIVAELVGEPVRGAEQLAVHVDLLLVPGAVADPHRTAVPPALQVRQFAFGQVVLAADAEHDLQARASGPTAGCRRGGHEGEEVARPRPGRRRPTAPPW